VNPRWLLWTVRGALLIALFVSAALWVDYSTASPEYCSVGSACDGVRRSGFGYIPLPQAGAFLPVPVVGVVGFALAYAATLLSSWQARRRWSLALLAAGAFVALGLLAAQAIWIGQFCSLCVTVDVAAIAAAAAAFLLPAEGWREVTQEERGERPSRFAMHPWGSALLAVLFALSPWLWPKVQPAPPVPARVAAYYQSDKINVVEFADFQCPFCRRLHGDLKRIIADYDGRVNFVRLHMPLSRHEYARPAARAAVCAEKQGQEPAMADRLFEAESLEQPAILEAAKALGLNLAEFERCIADPATDRIIDQQASILREAGFEGLPTTYVGATKIVGAQPEEIFREAFDQAASGAQATGIPAWLYWPLAALLAGLVVWLSRRKPVQAASPGT